MGDETKKTLKDYLTEEMLQEVLTDQSAVIEIDYTQDSEILDVRMTNSDPSFDKEKVGEIEAFLTSN